MQEPFYGFSWCINHIDMSILYRTNKERKAADSVLLGVGLQSVMKIGIPRSLFYYRFIGLWEVFFTELGAEAVVSDPTNKRILDDGVKACVDEACLPVKLFHGHVMNLIGRADYIFIPRFTSISRREYVCPEFGGLPDMVRHTLKDLPELIDTEINMRTSEKGAVKAAIETGARLGAGRRASRAAFMKALESYKDFRRRGLSGEIPPPAGPEGLRIALIGHSYNIYDRYISMNIIGKLKKYGAEVKTVEMVGDSDVEWQASRLSKPMFWNYGRNAYGAALHMAASGGIDGMICLSSFGCGIDSFIHDLIERKIRREYPIPFITITIDEHSGEAGFDTRLEAFIDMLRWRRSNENNISASG